MRENKFLIVGSIGSGKTTLANNISKILKIKNFELDDVVYKRRDIHEKRGPKKRNNKVKIILKRKKWIIEGFHSDPWTYPIYKSANKIIILKIKPSICKRRVFKRFLKRNLSFRKKTHQNKKLKTMLKLLKYIDKYPKKNFKDQKKASKLNGKTPLILKNNKQIKKFIKSIK